MNTIAGRETGRLDIAGKILYIDFMADKFRDDMIISDALEAHEGAAAVLERFGLPCARCAVAEVETIAQGAAGKGLETERILAALNALPAVGAEAGSEQATTGQEQESGDEI